MNISRLIQTTVQPNHCLLAIAAFALVPMPGHGDEPQSKPARHSNEQQTNGQQSPAVARTLAAMRATQTPPILVAAHRGGYENDRDDNAPENSIENIANCARRGYDLYETDIQRTSDGEFVICHDPTIDRETTGHGEARLMTLADLKKLKKRFRDGSVSESRVATLEEFLKHGKGQTVFKADLKPGVSSFLDELVKLIEAQDALDGIILRVQYRDLRVIRDLRESGLNIPPSLIMVRISDRDQLERVINLLHPRWVHVDVARDAPAQADTLDLIRYARQRGLLVQVHAEGSKDDWNRLANAGATMFHTTDPGAVLAFARSFRHDNDESGQRD